MKHLFFLFAASLLLMAAQCNEPDGEAFPLGEAFELTIGEQKACQCDGPAIKATAIKEDSRCPENTNCMWEGQAVVTFSLIDEGQKEEALELTLRKGHPKLSSKTVGAYQYTIQQVSPYPKDGVKINTEDYKIQLLIVKP
jgi:hypothetical protein